MPTDIIVTDTTDGDKNNVDSTTGPDYKIENDRVIYINKKLERKVWAHTAVPGFPLNMLHHDKNSENIQRILRVCDEKCFNILFENRNNNFQYEEFLKAAQKYKFFCNESNDTTMSLDDMCKLELATLFAHWTQDTGIEFTTGAPAIESWKNGLFFAYDKDCQHETDKTCMHHDLNDFTYSPYDNQWYWGRGAKRLVGNTNYGKFSEAFLGDKKALLEHPNRVSEEGWLSFGTSIWFYMTPQSPKPSMHDVVTKFWKPNNEDLKQDIKEGFGTTIHIISPGECGYKTKEAQNRIDYYELFMNYFNMEILITDEKSCAFSTPFVYGGEGTMYYHWAFNWTKHYECELVEWQTEYNLFEMESYERCIKDYRESNNHTGGPTIPTIPDTDIPMYLFIFL